MSAIATGLRKLEAKRPSGATVPACDSIPRTRATLDMLTVGQAFRTSR